MPETLPIGIYNLSTWTQPHANFVLRNTRTGREMECLGVFHGMQDFACSAKRYLESDGGTDVTLIPNITRRPWGREREVFHGYCSYEGFASTHKWPVSLAEVEEAYRSAWFGKDAPRIRIDDRGVHTEKGFTPWSEIPDE